MMTLQSFRRFLSTITKNIPESKEPLDMSKLHEINQNLHGKFGPIYKQNMGPIDGIFIADPK